MIETGNKAFWKYQLVGWSTLALSNLIVQYIAGYPIKLMVSNAIIPLISGFLVTTSYRYLIKRNAWSNLNFNKVLLLIIGSTLLLTLLMLGVMLAVLVGVLKLESPDFAQVLSNFVIFGLILLSWNLIYFCIHYFNSWNNAELEKWKLAAEMKDTQLGSLKSQINPHFVFNAINNIRSLILEDKEKAREMLLNFSDLFRYSINHTDQTTVPLKKELEMVNQYMELLSIQFEDKLDYQLQVDKGLEEIDVPPMMLQLLVENAIKHGISQFKNGGLIHIDIDQQNDFLIIKVKNTGHLAPTNSLGAKLGVGLQNIRKRLELMYSGKAQLKMKEVNDFVIASIEIPLL